MADKICNKFRVRITSKKIFMEKKSSWKKQNEMNPQKESVKIVMNCIFLIVFYK